MRSGFIMGQESNSSRAEYLAKSMINFRKLIMAKEVLEEIENISIGSIQNVIERIFNTAKPVLSIIGPDASSYKNVDITSLLQ